MFWVGRDGNTNGGRFEFSKGSVGVGRRTTEASEDGLQIVPGFPFRGGVTEKVSRVIGRHYGNAPIVLPGASDFGNRRILQAEEILESGGAERNNDFGLEEGQLLVKKGEAGGGFLGCWDAVLGRSTFDDIGDKNVIPRKPHRGDHFC